MRHSFCIMYSDAILASKQIPTPTYYVLLLSCCTHCMFFKRSGHQLMGWKGIISVSSESILSCFVLRSDKLIFSWFFCVISFLQTHIQWYYPANIIDLVNPLRKTNYSENGNKSVDLISECLVVTVFLFLLLAFISPVHESVNRYLLPPHPCNFPCLWNKENEDKKSTVLILQIF